MHDERMRTILPQIMDSLSAFLVPLMETMYAIQTDLYQHLYASMHEFATAQNLLDTDSIVDDCTTKYEPVRQHAESEIRSLREGKVARTPMGETGKPGMFARKSTTSMPAGKTGKTPPVPGSWDRKSSNSSLSAGGKTPPLPPPPSYESVRRASNSLAAPPNSDAVRRPSNGSLKAPPPPPPSAPSPLLMPTQPRQNSYSGPLSRTPSPSSTNSDGALAGAAKKKAPPPPPKPKAISPKLDFVIAKYDFEGEGQGDLAFRTGDRIRVVKKTESLDDWWEGELNGARGSFPRNYCS
jgi:amphiphysin